jgi:oligoribonuclease NrnB/cAMP/cGMP phosphodiesterase (DHH superfamily)
MRLLTRSDFDGICCAVLLEDLGVVDEMVYAHPKDLQDGKITVTENDVLANVPYVEGVGMWFDHHSSEEERLSMVSFKGVSDQAPSTARLIYDYYDGHEKLTKFDEMMKYVDKVDSADLSEDEILNPEKWVLLGLICDPRTGLGYHQDFKTSNLELMQNLVQYIRTMNIDEILEHDDVKERVAKYFENDAKCKEFIKETSRVEGKVVVQDTRGMDAMPPGNRFLVYSLFPDTNISVRILDAKGAESVSISVGHSITNKTSDIDVGSLMLHFGGGGHTKVGTCQVPSAEAESVLKEIVEACNS